MKLSTFWLVLLLLGLPAFGQQQATPHPIAYRQQAVEEKNFPVFSAMRRTAEVASLMDASPDLRQLRDRKRAAHQQAVSTCALELVCHLNAYRWTTQEIDQAQAELRRLVAAHPALGAWVQRELRASGHYQRHASASDAELLGFAWREAADGINRLIAVYGEGQPPRYPAIDAPIYPLDGQPYRRLANALTQMLAETAASRPLFFELPLAFGLGLLEMNLRDEAGRYEPMHLKENRAAFEAIASMQWDRFPYTVIVVPGAGSDRAGMALSPFGKMRLRLAAERYFAGKAPLVLVSGGHVHPNQTPFCEAIEMKRFLVEQLGLPEQAVLIDPHARHTTTNLRNAARILYRYGVPFQRKSLITTDLYQSAYIEDAGFNQRCMRELGYLPHRLLGRVNPFDLEWLPTLDALHVDPTDPLDP
ncbi:MAG: YdcF family protein [Bryobacterales bacterium]|nr:YdcF family protein [Bryobacterales bacterium]